MCGFDSDANSQEPRGSTFFWSPWMASVCHDVFSASPIPTFLPFLMLHRQRVTDSRLVSGLSATVRYPDPSMGLRPH